MIKNIVSIINVKFRVFTLYAICLFRFLQGPETDPATVRKIREAIDNQTEVTVQLINYTKSGKGFDFLLGKTTFIS